MCRCLGVVLACVFVTPPVFAADESIPAKKLDELKAATVYVKVEAKEGTATGSGFLIGVEGETGLVVTNQHVIREVPGRFTPQKITLVFWSGTRKEQVLPAEVIASDKEMDLAVLKVTSKGLPTPLDLTPVGQLRETMTIYTLGFPLGERLSTNKSNPALTIGKGTISSLREDEYGKLKRVQLDGELNPGNSGGPVVDPEGKLVGIAVSKIVGTKIGFAIPSAELNELLKGRVSALLIRSVRVEENGEAELEIEVPCLDPLHKIKTLVVRHVNKDALKEAPQADKDGLWPQLAGAEKVVLKIEGGKGIAKFKLKGLEKKSITYAFQATYTNGDDKLVVERPLYQTINFGLAGVVRPGDLKAGQGAPWETVTSKEGGFTVEMPLKPTINKSSARGRSGSGVTSLMIGCESENATYLALRIAYPTAVVQGAEEQALDTERDSLAKQWNGRVIGEKKVRAEGKIGRDFTIRGKPDGEDSVLTIRVRQYLVGKVIFMVLVVSAPDAELPDDAGRFLGSLALGESKTRASGTREPEPLGRELKGWGLAIDADKDCEFVPEAKSLSIKVPGTYHDLNPPDSGKLNSPRVMRAVEGDFVVTVKVSGDFKPAGKSTKTNGLPYNGAGLILWSDSDNFIRLERGAILRSGKVTTIVAFEEREGGYRGAVHNELYEGGTCYLRLERKGSRILGAISTDGSKWKQVKPIDTVWPTKLEIGVSAVNSNNEPFAVKFEEFDLKVKNAVKDSK